MEVELSQIENSKPLNDYESRDSASTTPCDFPLETAGAPRFNEELRSKPCHAGMMIGWDLEMKFL